jgi:replicative superfamily II helicase
MEGGSILQMEGRAGRQGMTDMSYGTCVIMCHNDHEEHYKELSVDRCPPIEST